MSYSQERWRELGKHLTRRRNALGYPRRSEFARHLRLTHDRTISDIENGRRDNYSAATLGQLEGYYVLAVGAIRDFLDGAPSLTADPGAGGLIAEASAAHGHDLDGMLSVVDVAGATAHRRAERDDEAGAWDALYALYTLLSGEFTGAQPPTTMKGGSADGASIGDADDESATRRTGEDSGGGNIRSLRNDERPLP